MKNKSDKLFGYYKKVVTSISTRIFNEMIKGGSENMMLIEELQNFSSDAINAFSKLFLERLNEGVDDYDNIDDEFIEATKNVFRDRLLDLGCKADFIPNEQLVNFCCRETVALIHYTKQIED